MAITDWLINQRVSVTQEGHIETAIHSPRLPFGAVHTESLTAQFQQDCVYGLNTAEIRTTTSGTGGVTAANNLLTASTGTSAGSAGTVQSRRRLRYRPGQGVVARYTALFSAPAANTVLVAGVGSSESGYYFGYNGTSFGVLHVTGGVREIQRLTVNTKSSTAENITVTLDSTPYLVAVTNGANTTVTANEIAAGTYAGWTAEAQGATVIFVANGAGNKTGTFSVTGSTISASFSEVLAGAASTDTWVPQSEWNGDPLDGSGASGVTLDPSKGNVYEIGVEYLGFGAVTMSVMVSYENENNTEWIVAHTFKHPNSRTTPHLSQPSFPFTMSAYSTTGTTNVSVSTASFAGFVAGEIRQLAGRFSYTASSTAVDAAGYRALISIRNDLVYGGRANQSVVNIVNIAAAVEHNNPVVFYLIRNGTLAGTPSWAQYSTTSCTYTDTAATTVSFANNNQLIIAIPLARTGDTLFTFAEPLAIQPGETITLAARSVFGSATYATMSVNTREDQ